MRLTTLDWIIVLASLLIALCPPCSSPNGRAKTRRSFSPRGDRPWWLAGLSMVATTFSSDTPNWVTQQVRQYGVAGNWQWWAFVLTGVSTVFFFARSGGGQA